MYRFGNAFHIFQSEGAIAVGQSVNADDNQWHNDKDCHPNDIGIREPSGHFILIHQQTPPLPHFRVCA